MVFTNFGIENADISDSEMLTKVHTKLARAKLRAVKLQSYWRRICEDERRSKQRNAQLLRDLDRMEANMATLDARREKLKHMTVPGISHVWE